MSQDSLTTAPESLMEIGLSDGSKIEGYIILEDSVSISFRTLAGLEVKIPRASITSLILSQGKVVGGVYYRPDPNDTRLMYAPTGRPLSQGEGYFSNVYVFFPGVAYGVTDNFSVLAGISIIPGVDPGDQLKYIAPRVGIKTADSLAISVGVLYLSVSGGNALGIAYGVGTIGAPDKSITVGLGLGFTKWEDEDVVFAEHPIFMFGGNIRTSKNTALILENWMITGEQFDLGKQPFAFAVRFIGERLSADVGLILIGEVISEGFPIPWLSITYNFERE